MARICAGGRCGRHRPASSAECCNDRACRRQALLPDIELPPRTPKPCSANTVPAIKSSVPAVPSRPLAIPCASIVPSLVNERTVPRVQRREGRSRARHAGPGLGASPTVERDSTSSAAAACCPLVDSSGSAVAEGVCAAAAALSKKRSSSTGNGITRVLFFSAATSTTVCSSRSCRAAGVCGHGARPGPASWTPGTRRRRR